MRLASVPAWVVERHSATAIAVYAALDIQNGGGTQSGLAKLLGSSPPTIKKAIEELIEHGTIRRKQLAIYELRRDEPTRGLSTASTELCTGSSTGSDGGEAFAGAAPRELSSSSTGPTSSTRGLEAGEKARGIQSGKPPDRVLVDGRYLAYDAISVECNADPRARSGEIAAALKKIRQWCWDALCENGMDVTSSAFEVAVAEMIRQKAQKYRERMDGAHLTPSALAKWWFDVEKLGQKGGLSPDQIARGEY